jgi:hypothetical protein
MLADDVRTLRNKLYYQIDNMNDFCVDDEFVYIDNVKKVLTYLKLYISDFEEEYKYDLQKGRNRC